MTNSLFISKNINIIEKGVKNAKSANLLATK